MKKITTLFVMLAFLSFGLIAQPIKTVSKYSKVTAPAKSTVKNGYERVDISKGSYLKQTASDPSYGDTVGYTWYDYQSNAGMQQRIFRDNAGNIQVIWTKALDTIQDPSNANRGIGYNYYDASSGNWIPGDSLNTNYGLAEKRVGWPCIAPIAGNGEAIFAHTDRLYTNPTKGQTNISPVNLSGTLHSASGVTFYHATAEGSTIYTVHDNGVAFFFGRSDDNGATWNISEVAIDSVTGNPLNPTATDGYDIDAKGDSVAIVSGGHAAFTGVDPNDVYLYLSTDRGATWTATMIHDFDTLNADTAAGGGYNVLTPHSDVRVLIGNDGKIHLTGTVMGTITDPGTLSSASWLPLNKGVWYWNSDMPAGFDINDPADYSTYVLFDSVPDLTTMGSYPNDGDLRGEYVTGLFSHASISTDQNGNLAIVYSGTTCGSDNNPFDNRFRRDLFGFASGDGGATWSDPKNIASLLFANDITDGTVGEEAYPVAAKRSNDGQVHILFQYDSWAGATLVDDFPILEENKMTYLAIPINQVGLKEESKVASFKIYPNPAFDVANIVFDSNVNGKSNIVISNLIGQQIKSVETELVIGQNSVTVDLSDVKKGIYLVTVGNGKNKMTQKIVVE